MVDFDKEAHAREVAAVLLAARAELNRARSMHAPMASPFEGWAVIREEVDEFWDDVKANRPDDAVVELIQVAAMGLQFATQSGRNFAQTPESELEFATNVGIIEADVREVLAQTVELPYARLSRSLHESYAAVHIAASQLLTAVVSPGPDRIAMLTHAGTVLAAAAVSSVVDHRIRAAANGR